MLSPPINVIQYHFSDTFAMFLVEKFLNPLHKVILKCAFDELMQNIRCKHYIDDDVVPPRRPLPDQGDGILLRGAMEALRDFLRVLRQLDLRQLDLLKKQS